MTPKGHAIPSKTQLLSYGTPAFSRPVFFPDFLRRKLVGDGFDLLVGNLKGIPHIMEQCRKPPLLQKMAARFGAGLREPKTAVVSIPNCLIFLLNGDSQKEYIDRVGIVIPVGH